VQHMITKSFITLQTTKVIKPQKLPETFKFKL